MSRRMLTIAKKELDRFFSNKVSAVVSIVLPGLLIFAMWSVMGTAMNSTFDGEGEGAGSTTPTIAAVNLPASVAFAAEATGITVVEADAAAAGAVEPDAMGTPPDAAALRQCIKDGDFKALAVFPANFDAAVAAREPNVSAAEGAAPQVGIYYDATNAASSAAYAQFSALLDAYESRLVNLFDVNAGEGAYDVSEERDRAAMIVVSIVPMLLLVLLFSGCMSVAAEAVAGEKERGTMATLLATPIDRRDIAFGKVLALSLIGLLVAASSMIGIFASLPNLAQGSLDVNVYGVAEYVQLVLVILSTTLLIVALISIVSALAKTTKEAQLYLTPVMIVVVGVGLAGMFGDGAQTQLAYYAIPLYNSVQCMIGVFMFDFQPAAIALCVACNLVYTAAGVAVLQKMFNSERLMFAR